MLTMNDGSNLPANYAVLSISYSGMTLPDSSHLALSPPHCHYHLIPSLPALFFCAEEAEEHSKAWHHLAMMLETSKQFHNRIFDFSTCLKYQGYNRAVRVIFSNGRILAIRPALFSDGINWSSWARFQVEIMRLPPSIQTISGQETCPIGEVYLEFANAKLAPLFGTQVRMYKDLLKIYQALGVEVYSVSDFCTSTEEYDLVVKTLVSHSTNGCSFLYGNPQGALSQSEVYGGGSLIGCGTQLLAQMKRFSLDCPSTISAGIDLNAIKQSKMVQLENNRCCWKRKMKLPERVECGMMLVVQKKVQEQYRRQYFLPSYLEKEKSLFMSYKLFILDFFKNFNCHFVVFFQLTHKCYTLIRMIKELARQLQTLFAATQAKTQRLYQLDLRIGRERTYPNILSKILTVVQSETLPDEVLKSVFYQDLKDNLGPNLVVMSPSLREWELNEEILKGIFMQVSEKNDQNLIFACQTPTNRTISKFLIDYNQLLDRDFSMGLLPMDIITSSQFPAQDASLLQLIENQACQKKNNKHDLIKQAQLLLMRGMGLSGVHKRMKSSDGLAQIIKASKRNAIKSVKTSRNDLVNSYLLLQNPHKEIARLNKCMATNHTASIDATVNTRIQSSIEEIEHIRTSKRHRCHLCKLFLESKNGETCRSMSCTEFFCHHCLIEEYNYGEIGIEKMAANEIECPVCLNLCKFQCCAKLKKTKNDIENVHLCHFCMDNSCKIKVMCSNLKCKNYFCKDCLKQEFNITQSIGLLAGNYICQVCTNSCHCLRCQKIALSEEKKQVLRISNEETSRKIILKKRTSSDTFGNFFKPKDKKIKLEHQDEEQPRFTFGMEAEPAPQPISSGPDFSLIISSQPQKDQGGINFGIFEQKGQKGEKQRQDKRDVEKVDKPSFIFEDSSEKKEKPRFLAFQQFTPIGKETQFQNNQEFCGWEKPPEKETFKDQFNFPSDQHKKVSAQKDQFRNWQDQDRPHRREGESGFHQRRDYGDKGRNQRGREGRPRGDYRGSFRGRGRGGNFGKTDFREKKPFNRERGEREEKNEFVRWDGVKKNDKELRKEGWGKEGWDKEGWGKEGWSKEGWDKEGRGGWKNEGREGGKRGQKRGEQMFDFKGGKGGEEVAEQIDY